MTQGTRVSPARRRAIQALVSSVSFEDAAAKAGVRQETLWRWFGHDRDFQAALREERRRQREAASAGLDSLLALAVRTLEDVMCDGDAPAEARVEAARTTFEVAAQLHVLSTLDERVSALETWSKQRRAKKAGDLRVVAAGADRSA